MSKKNVFKLKSELLTRYDGDIVTDDDFIDPMDEYISSSYTAIPKSHERLEQASIKSYNSWQDSLVRESQDESINIMLLDDVYVGMYSGEDNEDGGDVW